jgi:hypothetical protein
MASHPSRLDWLLLKEASELNLVVGALPYLASGPGPHATIARC